MKWFLGYFVYRRFRLIFEILLENITNADDYNDDEQNIDVHILASQLANEAADLFYRTGDYEYDYGTLAHIVMRNNHIKITYDEIEPVLSDAMPYWVRTVKFVKSSISNLSKAIHRHFSNEEYVQ